MKILVIEDNQKLADSLKRGLEREGFAVDCLSDGIIAEKRILINRDEYDVALLDIMLPQKDGVSLCKALRKAGVTLPVLMLTARGGVEEKIQGLDAGADDYLAKPFSFEELLARIRALLRRPGAIMPSVLLVGDIVLDTTSHTVTHKEKKVILTLKEFMALEYLMRHVNQVVERDTLYDHAWDFSDSSFSNTVDVHIKNLRKKLHDNGSIIQTIRGRGYKLVA